MNCGDPMNSRRFVGWDQTANALGEPYKYLFEQKTIDTISTKISQLLDGVVPETKIVYPDIRIREVIGQIFYNSKRPDIGSIASKDIIPNEQARNDIRFIIAQTIEIITKTLRTELEMIENNKKLSIWNSVYGDFNEKGLRAHPPIKIRHKRPQPMMFNMNY